MRIPPLFRILHGHLGFAGDNFDEVTDGDL
jgi:hypothetical protein